MAATWVQSWRLSSMRNKITRLLTYNGSLVLYREPDSAFTDSEGTAYSVELENKICFIFMLARPMHLSEVKLNYND